LLPYIPLGQEHLGPTQTVAKLGGASAIRAFAKLTGRQIDEGFTPLDSEDAAVMLISDISRTCDKAQAAGRSGETAAGRPDTWGAALSRLRLLHALASELPKDAPEANPLHTLLKGIAEKPKELTDGRQRLKEGSKDDAAAGLTVPLAAIEDLKTQDFIEAEWEQRQHTTALTPTQQVRLRQIPPKRKRQVPAPPPPHR